MTIPLIIAGAALIMAILERAPILVWAGAGLLGWVAGEMIVSDPWLETQFGEEFVPRLELPAAALGAAIVVALAYLSRRRSAARA